MKVAQNSSLVLPTFYPIYTGGSRGGKCLGTIALAISSSAGFWR